MEPKIQKYVNKLKAASVVQIGSSLRKDDFTPYSDYDFLAIYNGSIRKKIIHDEIQDREIDVVRRSKSQFMKLLKTGSPYDLIALNHGKILKDDGFFTELRERKEKFRPTGYTSDFWMKTASYNLSWASMGYPDSVDVSDFLKRLHHVARDFSRAIILWKGKKLVEGNDEIVGELLELSLLELIPSYYLIFEAREQQEKFKPRIADSLSIKDSGIGQFILEAEKFAEAAYSALWNIQVPKVNSLIHELIKANKLSEDVKKNHFHGFHLEDESKELAITFIIKKKVKSFTYDLVRGRWKEEQKKA